MSQQVGLTVAVLQRLQQVNSTSYRQDQKSGHYESFFQRANHPSRPLAFWIRYTIFSPQDRPEDAMGALWAVYFDGETHEHVAVRSELPFKNCTFKTDEFFVRVGDARLEPGNLCGSIAANRHRLSWTLTYSGDSDPLFLMPIDPTSPQAKALTGLPLAVYNGVLHVDGREIAVADWVGSENHNWGVKHTDHYAYGQVAGFDNDPQAFLEVATARARRGSDWSPFVTPVVLRHRGRDLSLNSRAQVARAGTSFSYSRWRFKSETDEIMVDGTIAAPREAFIGFNYRNPTGGIKNCLNTMIASCELRVTCRRQDGTSRTDVLVTGNRACFEILTDERDHGIEIRA
ncbi:MAG TPA: hypothetical protein VJT33_10540 [bacterium]|nr:hypothetical protein [bacterium]